MSGLAAEMKPLLCRVPGDRGGLEVDAGHEALPVVFGTEEDGPQAARVGDVGRGVVEER